MSEKGELLIAKNQLELTIVQLTEEIEKLSLLNQRLIRDLKSENFFQKYHETLEELNQLKLEHEMLIDHKYEYKDQKVSPSLSVVNISRPVIDDTHLHNSIFR